ncbi:response regulator [Paenibacillus hexagrammi]|uniref:Response regulator n=1 Tax=Paenibacillus hexagrammi TaxID=2908839 RepID=A0ABY3SG02_9BACL|nr:response regulator [Paenibacillus sp. YPD9-1]UJF32902.1 response regulator [Paenibacillus sp. YPD9-1]
MAKVMIVDDAAFMRAMLKGIITEMGFEVVAEAGNGQEAVKNFQQYHPDLVTMDITMPDMDGVAAVRSIMQINDKAKIIMCSAMGQQKMVLDAIQAGAKDFIVKPFDRVRVSESILKVLSK